MQIKILDTINKLSNEISNIVRSPVLAIDTETTGISWYKHKIFMVQLCNGWTTWIIPVYQHDWEGSITRLFIALKLHTKLLIGHNLKFDLHHIRHSFGIELLTPQFFDTKVAAHLLNENRDNKLKSLMKSELHIGTPEEINIKQWFKEKKIKNEDQDYSKIPQEIILPYAIVDVVNTFKLYEKFEPAIKQYFGSLFDTEMKLLKILFKMEQNGVRIDVPYLEELQMVYGRKLSYAVSDLLIDVGKDINFNSSQQVGKYLYEKLKLPILKQSEKTEKPSTDITVLQQLDHPFIEKLLHYKKLQKIHSTYIKNLLKYNHHGMIYANYNQARAETGRFSCSNPNLQNQAKIDDIKRIFLPDEGHEMIWWDQSQMEMIGFAHYSRELKMREMFKRGEDIYAGTAKQVLRCETITKHERQMFKNMNLAMIFCVGKDKLGAYLSANLNRKVSYNEAISFRKEYLKTFPRVKEFMYEVMDVVKISRVPWGHYIKNMYGRVRRVAVSKAYTAVNHLIQGWAADVMKESMVKIEEKFHPNWKMQLHDAIRLDRPVNRYRREEFIHEVSECLSYCPKIDIPIRVKVESSKTNWAEVL